MNDTWQGRRTWLWLGAFAWICGSLGCQSGAISARSLPAELHAPRMSSVQKLDLSRLAQSQTRSEQIYPGDILDLSIVTGLEDQVPEPIPLRVSDDGTLNVPLVGPVMIAGMALQDAERAVRDESIRRGVYRAPQVALLVNERRSISVTVVGAVKEPGIKKIDVNSNDLLSAIVAAGGLEKDAGTTIEIRHPAGVTMITEAIPGPQPGGPNTQFAGFRRRQVQLPARSTKVDLKDAVARGNSDLHLEDGSTVMVMKQPDRIVHVMGLVKAANQYQMPVDQDFRVLDAIAKAGGRTLEIADSVTVIRQVPGTDKPVVISISVREAKSNSDANIRLAEGDVVTVEETPSTFVINTLREFVRFGISGAVPLF